eukprot:comp22596_c0_seq1/m.34630 comp22596_c0_seq1/g.34630  ORF comp22596_c0_seq1/g.34630 comp22596_c0_seq1/m.34630 type:complete len:541 (-) comp22596_c0_seq1:232-1854(-)
MSVPGVSARASESAEKDVPLRRSSKEFEAVSNTALVDLEEKSLDSDDAVLATMGYKQELTRGFNAFMSFGFCFTSVNVVSSMSISLEMGLLNGGPAIMVYEWFLAGTMTILAGLSLAEICSKYPSAGSVYHYAGVLAGPKYCALASYVDGWFNFIGNMASCASFGAGIASLISAATVVAGGDPAGISTYVQVGIALATLAGFMLINILKIGQQGYVYSASVVFQLFSAVGLAICIIALTPERASPSFVFTTTYDGTGFGNMGYAALLGLLLPCFSMCGYEAGAHLAEETRSASRSAPWGIVYCCLCSSIFGFVYLLGLLFGISDLDAVVNNEYNSATIKIFVMALGQTGALIATCVLIVNVFLAGVSSMTVSSRVAFAMARDDGLFLSSWVKKVTFNSIPVNSIIVVFVGAVLLNLLSLVSTTAFAAITSISVIGYQISYAIPLWLRCTISRDTFKAGEFSLGKFSVPCAFMAAVWLTFSAFLLIFPVKYPITIDTFNWTIVVTVGVVILAGITWLTSARHTFEGPKKTLLEHAAGTEFP